MASAHVSTRSILSSFLPRLSAPTASNPITHATLISRQLSHPLLPSFGFALPAAIQLNVPGLIEGIWESILKAVPKKKTSHMKQRSRRMAGKGLKDITSLNRCSVCGNLKRAHLLCPFCVAEVRNFFKGNDAFKQKSAEHNKLEIWKKEQKDAKKQERKDKKEAETAAEVEAERVAQEEAIVAEKAAEKREAKKQARQ